jgi:Ser/Thr protein kinase RdoA (MazF antagonist)
MDIDAICAAFDLGAPTAAPAYVARGELGRVSRLQTHTGVWAVKEVELFVPTVEEADANAALQESMLAAGVDLPRPRRTVDGHGIFENVRVYEWLDLTAVPDGGLAGEEMVAETLARMHRHAPATDDAPDPWYVATVAKHEWNELVERGAASWWSPILADLVPELVDLAPPDHSPARVCHLDVCPENVFLSAGRLTVIDWENAGPAATRQDLGSTLWDFCRGDRTRTRAFVDHYRRHGGPLERFDASVFDTARVVQANLIDFHARRALDPHSPPERQERAERALRDCLARTLTQTVVDDLVD